MHNSMPDYITELSGNDFEVLEEIFVDKYNKFIHLYWLLKEYSENISELHYNSSGKDELNISVKVVNVKPSTFMEELSDSIDNSEAITIWNNKRLIQICIKDKEEEEGL